MTILFNGIQSIEEVNVIDPRTINPIRQKTNQYVNHSSCQKISYGIVKTASCATYSGELEGIAQIRRHKELSKGLQQPKSLN